MGDATSGGGAAGPVVELEVTIEASAAVVYEYLTVPARLLEWIAAEAEVEPVAGGVVRWRHENGDTMRGRFVELVPGRRLVFSYGWEGELMGVPPESTTVEIDLIAAGEATRLLLRHSGLAQAVADQHRAGWMYFLERLAGAAGGQSS